MQMTSTVPWTQNGQPSFIKDLLTREHVLAGGARLKASEFVSDNAVKVVVGVAGALATDTTIPVAALPAAIPKGALLDFGPRAAVLVKLSANANADAVVIYFDALTGPIPSGTVLDFGGKKTAKTTAAAATGATQVAVSALAAQIIDNDEATYPGVTARTAKLTADKAKDATSLTVEALPEGLVSTDVAYYTPPGEKKRVAAGKLVGCTFAELEAAAVVTNGVPAGLDWGPAADTDDIVRFTVFDVDNVDDNPDCDLLRPGTLIDVNHVPNWSSLSSTLKGKVRSFYEVSVGNVV